MSQRLSMMSIERSGVRTCTFPGHRPSSWPLREAALGVGVSPAPDQVGGRLPRLLASRTRTWVRAPLASSKLVCRAAHGSCRAGCSLQPVSAGQAGGPVRWRHCGRGIRSDRPSTSSAVRRGRGRRLGRRIRYSTGCARESPASSGSRAVTIRGRCPRARCPEPTRHRRSRTDAWSVRIGSRSSTPRS